MAITPEQVDIWRFLDQSSCQDPLELSRHSPRNRNCARTAAGREKAATPPPWFSIAEPDHAFDLCADLARRHGPKLGVRTLESLHVACALELKAKQFWTFDDRQAKLAKAEGLKTA